MSWIEFGVAVAVFGIAVVLIALGTLAGRPLSGSCGGSCACADREDGCIRGDGSRRQQRLRRALPMERKHG